MKQAPSSYDSVPYPSYTFPQTHPDRLSTVGSTFGVSTAYPEHCRMLELGCGDGTNILSFAYALPDSQFHGIDLSQTHIDRARHACSELGVENATFRQADISVLSAEELGQFDFIIAHGLYSWVPDEVRGHIRRIYRECLSPVGIGYISYNTYPGCHIREISSEIMKIGRSTEDDPIKQVETATAFLTAVANSAEEDSLYQAMLRIELSHIVDRSKQNVFHDDLSDLNQPFYFSDFVREIDEAGLKFLSEADASLSHSGKLSPEGQRMLLSVGDNTLLREQLYDLIICRRFRCSLVCKAEAQPTPNRLSGKIREYYISGRLEHDADLDKIASQVPVLFRGHDGTTVSIDHRLTKAALDELRKIYARSITFDELVARASNRIGVGGVEDTDVSKTSNILEQFYSAGLISFHRYQPQFANVISERPEVSGFARWQLRNGSESVTSLTGINLVPGNPVAKSFLSMLDGTRTQSEVLSVLKGSVDISPDEMDDFRRTLPSMVEMELMKFAEAGLLIS